MMIITDNLISTYVFQMHYSLSGGNIFSTIETDQMRRVLLRLPEIPFFVRGQNYV